ncbi:GNAT family N-acetyltransferase [Nitratireductor pacificus]|uniref:N-acetyltransferase domain-containing protein n=1 Tax=Nitratireductor pacificus pht-3B TaxID=391937 RepID=K2MGZ1_9HYPH|nr:GNAT family N-acetyltransferase [Nitratireductor pacificus]EKF19975.1 hypothetical protein NA2_04266 [Nitratireductor pacificus pht-3B]
MHLTFETTDNPDPKDERFIETHLSAFNDADVGASGKRQLSVFVRDGTGTVAAGISGYTAWGWLYVQRLWVSESLRGQRMAGRMLEQAEREAIARGCHGAFIDTFNPSAAKAYLRQGYHPFGALDDFPAGRSRIFLQKRLGEGSGRR